MGSPRRTGKTKAEIERSTLIFASRVMWFAGGLAALSSITYPSISAFVSVYAKENQQGLVQGMVNGVRGLCNGLGPALFGFIFYLFNVNLNESVVPLGPSSTTLSTGLLNRTSIRISGRAMYSSALSRDVPGPPFLFGALLATVALMFSLLLPNSKPDSDGVFGDTRTIEQKARLLDLDNDATENLST